jgi:hypothetical protein
MFSNVYQSIRQTNAVPQRMCEKWWWCTAQVDDDILEMVQCHLTTSIWRTATELHTPQTTLWRTVHDFSMYAFHILNIQALQPNDHFAQEELCHQLLCNQVLCTKILFTNEAFFNKDGITNTWNSHVWSSQEENPHTITETHFQTCFLVNIWCSITTNLITGLFELEDCLTGGCYSHFLQDELLKLLEDMPLEVRHMWLQQDGTPAHFGATAFLNWRFPYHWIGQGGLVTWPVRSPDLTPTDYFLGGCMKSLVYIKRSNSRTQLINWIMDANDQIRNDQWWWELLCQLWKGSKCMLIIRVVILSRT